MQTRRCTCRGDQGKSPIAGAEPSSSVTCQLAGSARRLVTDGSPRVQGVRGKSEVHPDRGSPPRGARGLGPAADRHGRHTAAHSQCALQLSFISGPTIFPSSACHKGILQLTTVCMCLLPGATVGFAMNAYKQNQIFPPPSNPELSSNKNQSALHAVPCWLMREAHRVARTLPSCVKAVLTVPSHASQC